MKIPISYNTVKVNKNNNDLEWVITLLLELFQMKRITKQEFASVLRSLRKQ